MLFYLILLFTLVPIFELFVLIQAGQIIGPANTVAVVFLTGIVGAYLARSQGRRILGEIQQRLSHNELPADSFIHGLLVFVGGVLLVTPGFVTDVVGFSLVLPLTRSLLLGSVKRFLMRQVRTGSIHVYTTSNFGRTHRPDSHVVDVTPEPDASREENSKNSLPD